MWQQCGLDEVVGMVGTSGERGGETWRGEYSSIWIVEGRMCMYDEGDERISIVIIEV